VNGNTSLLTTEVTLLPPHLIGSTFLTHCCVVNRNDGPAEPAADNSKKRIEVLEKLLASGALLSNKDANGLTVLQLALQCGDVDVALQLVRILVNLVGVRESKRGSKVCRFLLLPFAVASVEP
jgi:ankyrin repeat protein